MITNYETGSAAAASAVIDGVTAASNTVMDWLVAAGVVDDPQAEATKAAARAQEAQASAAIIAAQLDAIEAEKNRETILTVVGIAGAVYLLSR